MSKQRTAEIAQDITLADVGRLAGEIIGHRLEVARLENVCKRKQDTARKEFQDAAAEAKAAIKAKEAVVEAWARRQPRSNDQPLSWAFPRAVVRLITGQPRVALRYRVTLADVVERLKAVSWGFSYLRTPEHELDKEALLRDRNYLNSEVLENIGVRIAQDDEVLIDAPKPTQQAAQEAA